MIKKIICDKCKKKINVKLIEKNVGNGLIEIFFICNKCKEKYHVGYINKYIKEIQCKQKMLRNQIRNILENNGNNLLDFQYIQLENELDDLVIKLKKEMDKINPERSKNNGK